MTTLLYGEPGLDVQAGNRADDEIVRDTVVDAAVADNVADTVAAPRLRMLRARARARRPTVEIRALAASTVPPPRPMYPPPDPWLQPRSLVLSTLMLGMAAAGAIFAGLAVLGIATVWSHQMTLLAELGLMVLGAYLVSIGVAYVATFEEPKTA